MRKAPLKTSTNRFTREHAIEIPLAVEIALQLFTPFGEMDKIVDWHPRFIHPEDSATMEGMSFTTDEGEAEIFLSCIAWSPETLSVRYARVTPASRFAHSAVACLATRPQTMRVEFR